MGARLKIRTERVSIAAAGVSQVLTSSHMFTWSVSVFADIENSAPIYTGNDGNDTVSSTTGRPLFPGGHREYNSRDFFSPYECYIDMSTIFVICDDPNATYRLEYWVSI